jgi:integrase
MQLSPAHIKGLEAKLLKEGMSPAGAELVHNVLSGALKHGVRMEVLWRNAAKVVMPPRVTRKEIEPPDIDKVRRVLARGEADGHPLWPAIHRVACTGIRRGECLALTWTNVDLDRGHITITQSLIRSHEKGLILEPTKTERGRRAIDLDPYTVGVLRAHRVRQLEHRLKVGKFHEDQDLVFADPLGGPANPMALTRAYKSLAKEEGIAVGRLHDLRHFHASLLFQQGESPVLVQQRLGHSTLTTTADIYWSPVPRPQKEAAIKFADKMRGQG